jgi:acetyltransferase-like isoleucine patch superfamily enzyme
MNTNQQIYPNVKISEGGTLGLFIIIGEPPRGATSGEVETIIGAHCLIRSHTVIYAGNKIGDNFQTGHQVLVRESNTIGDNVSIGSHSIIEHHIEIRDNVRIHSNVFIPEFSLLEEDTWIGPNVVFTNARYPLSQNVKKELVGPRILRGAKIGANSTLLPGIVIGANALVGAGSVVLHDVPDRAVVVGNPARIVNWLDNLDPYKFLINRKTDE